jgi:hypothetical protein
VWVKTIAVLFDERCDFERMGLSLTLGLRFRMKNYLPLFALLKSSYYFEVMNLSCIE